MLVVVVLVVLVLVVATVIVGVTLVIAFDELLLIWHSSM